MIAYLAVFALGVVLGALAFLCVVMISSPDDEMIEDYRSHEARRELTETIAMHKAIAQENEIRRRFESECG